MGEPARRNYPKGAARRQAIIESATALFAERGFSAGSTRELAKRVGLTQSGMLHHFSNKEELLTEVLKQRDEELSLAFETSAAGTFQERLAVTARHNEGHVGLTSLFSVLSGEATEETHPAHAYFQHRYAELARTGAEEFRKAQEAGDADADVDPDLAARLIIAVLDGALLQPAYLTSTVPSQLTDLLWSLLSRDTRNGRGSRGPQGGQQERRRDTE